MLPCDVVAADVEPIEMGPLATAIGLLAVGAFLTVVIIGGGDTPV